MSKIDCNSSVFSLSKLQLMIFIYLFGGIVFLSFPQTKAFGESLSPSPTNPHEVYPSQGTMPQGIVGVAVHISAHRVGDAAKMYVRAVHPEGPAARAGLVHGDEILEVDGNAVNGKTYQQIIRLIRGDVGQSVKLKVHGQQGTRTVSISRVSEEQLIGRQRTTFKFSSEKRG